jgi:hypothetical protein
MQEQPCAPELFPVLQCPQHTACMTIRQTRCGAAYIRIVLERIPLWSVLEQIEAALRHIIAPIPAKPAPVQTVTAEPHIMTPDEASTSQ